MRIIALLLLSGIAFAGPDVEQEIEIIGGDTILNASESSKAFGFGHAMGDVDIAQCLGSTQWDTILGGKQKLVLNNVCMAEFYLKSEKWDLAAMALCNQPEILSEFATEQECEDAHNFGPPPELIVPTSGPQECCEDQIEQQHMVQESITKEVESLEQRVARIERDKIKKREYAQFTMEKIANDPDE